MKLQVPFIQLPLQFDAERMAREVAALGSGPWREHPQKLPGNFALPLIAVGGDAGSDAVSGPMQPTPHLLQCPYLQQVLSRLGAVWGRTRLMRLDAGAEVSPHVDINYYWRERVRVHVPIVTHPDVRFMCGDAEVNMASGECWIFDTWRSHQVRNASSHTRIHLVADTVGSDSLGQLVGAGRVPGHGALAGWHVENVEPQPATTSPLRLEAVNVPQVMTPWELREHLLFLLGETHPHPQLMVARQYTLRLCAIWQALWAEYGTDRAGWPAYRAALDAYEQQMERSAVALELLNGALFMNTLRGMVLRVALNDHDRAAPAGEPRHSIRADAAGRAANEVGTDPLFDRPVFIISPPRAGSTLLFETLARAPQVFSIGHESHALLEGLPELHPAQRGFDSNRLDAAACHPALMTELRRRFQSELRDRHRQPPVCWPVRMLEKTPKNALRVPFLARAFPQAHFVYLHRDPQQTLASMLEAWRSGRFRTYPQLPDWSGPPWSLLLVPEWRRLNGRPLEEIVAAQWEITTRILLDDLQALPPERVHVAHYAALVAQPAVEVARLCAALDFAWDQPLDAALPLSRFTLSPPAADKWQKHAAAFAPWLPGLHATMERAAQFATR
ncbi:MAG TPA: sulfotransferase [Rhodanobacter sp.]|nr:sulfotransferase [Rhodanobacter sp.]